MVSHLLAEVKFYQLSSFWNCGAGALHKVVITKFMFLPYVTRKTRQARRRCWGVCRCPTPGRRLNKGISPGTLGSLAHIPSHTPSRICTAASVDKYVAPAKLLTASDTQNQRKIAFLFCKIGNSPQNNRGQKEEYTKLWNQTRISFRDGYTADRAFLRSLVCFCVGSLSSLTERPFPSRGQHGQHSTRSIYQLPGETPFGLGQMTPVPL